MKKLKSLTGLLLALTLALMTLSFTSITANAATANLTINVTSGNYSAYQIFSGTYSSTTKSLGDLDWGSAIKSGETDNSGKFITALKNASDSTNDAYVEVLNGIFSSLTESSTASDVAAILGKYTSEDDSAVVNAIAQVIVSYLKENAISDTAVSYPTSDSSYTQSVDTGYYIVYQTDSSTGTPAMIDLVGDTTVSPKTETDTSTPNVVKSIDSTTIAYSYGEIVPFKVTVTLPSTITDYSTYYLMVNDTLTNLEYYTDTDHALSAVITYTENSSEVTTDVTSLFTASVDESNSTKLSISGTLTNTSTTTNDVTTYLFSNYAGATITFTYYAKVLTAATYDFDGTKNSVTLTYNNDPTSSGSGGSTTTTTEEKEVTVYTYQLQITKTDGTDALSGAGFTLYKLDTSSNEYVEVGAATASGNNSNIFTWDGLGDGTYKLVETTVPNGYNKAADIYFTITTSESGDTVSATITTYEGSASSTALSSGDTGYLTVDVSSTADSQGTITGTIANSTGATLPSTGGMGTKVFYTLGGILVVAAAVLLITKRRLGENS